MARPRHNSGLTGGLSRFGILVKNGYELWKETVNAAGGIEVAGKKMKAEIVYYDDQSENETSAKLTEKLITDDKVQFLLSPFGSGPTFATTAIGEKYNIITMASMANAGSIYDRGFKNVFSIAPPGEVFLWSFLDLMKTVNPVPQKVAIITPNDVFPVSVAKGAREKCKELGFDVVYYEEYPKGVKDLSSTILKIKGSGAEVLMSSGYLEEAILTRRQLSEQRVRVKAMCFTTGPEHDDFRKILGEDANNVFGVSWWMPDMRYSGPLFGSSSDYTNVYTRRFGPGITQQAAGASQAGLLLQLAIEKAGSLDTGPVRDALKAYEGTTFWGPTKWDNTGLW
jgi:branched-chain amino acid transport system substrate-binding protein